MSTKLNTVSDEEFFIEGITRFAPKLSTKALIELMDRAIDIYRDPKFRKEQTRKENNNG